MDSKCRVWEVVLQAVAEVNIELRIQKEPKLLPSDAGLFELRIANKLGRPKFDYPGTRE